MSELILISNETAFLGALGIGLALVIVVIIGFFIYFSMRKKRDDF